MPPAALYTALLALTLTQMGRSTQEDHHHVPRVIISHKEMAFKTYELSSTERNGVLKLLKDPNSQNIYAGGPKGLYKLKSEESRLQQVTLPDFLPQCKDGISGCPQNIKVLTDGGNGLFICVNKNCCNLNSEHTPGKCFNLETQMNINEPSLYTGDTLYYTVSGESNTAGLYKKAQNSYMWPQSREIAQRYIKLIAEEGTESPNRKLYSFYIEKNGAGDPEMPLWIPYVSQYCMGDTGGNKNHLQYRWTSMLTTRLFCGNQTKKVTYTELLDVAVLQGESDTLIYALFTNTYDVSAVCIYKMSTVTRILKSGKFNVTERAPSSAGECVSEKSEDLLKFMGKRPAMKEWIEPERGPLLVTHRQYTHLQVDRVEGRNNVNHTILLLTLANGKVHKVLEQDGDAFIIAEYQPFENKTHILSTLLDRSTKMLYVSSSSEVVQINLQNCSMHKKCSTCVMARDPYCGWSGSSCLPVQQYSSQDVGKGDDTVCAGRPTPSMVRTDEILNVPQQSKFYLTCPTTSQHASYVWNHERQRRECISTENNCLLLLESMSTADEGLYRCLAMENGQERTIVSYQLRSSALQPKMTPAMLAFLLLFILLIN